MELAAEALERAKDSDCELTLPVDLVLGESFDAATERRESDGVEVPDGWMGLDIGPRTAALYAEAVAGAGTVLWNGPMGAFEMEPFAGRHPGRRRGGRRRARHDRGRRRRLGRGAAQVRPRRPRSTGFRPEEEHPWSCWRERSCPGSRPCSTRRTTDA